MQMMGTILIFLLMSSQSYDESLSQAHSLPALLSSHTHTHTHTHHHNHHKHTHTHTTHHTHPHTPAHLPTQDFISLHTHCVVLCQKVVAMSQEIGFCVLTPSFWSFPFSLPFFLHLLSPCCLTPSPPLLFSLSLSLHVFLSPSPSLSLSLSSYFLLPSLPLISSRS